LILACPPAAPGPEAEGASCAGLDDEELNLGNCPAPGQPRMGKWWGDARVIPGASGRPVVIGDDQAIYGWNGRMRRVGDQRVVNDAIGAPTHVGEQRIVR
jgi:hypothetical protein